jgi:hypothetical protein
MNRCCGPKIAKHYSMPLPLHAMHVTDDRSPIIDQRQLHATDDQWYI